MTKVRLMVATLVLASALVAGLASAGSSDRACKDRCWKESNKISNAAQRAKVRQACMSKCK